MKSKTTGIASICSNPNVAVALVNSARPYWAHVDRYDMRGFGEYREPLVLLEADDHIRDLMDALAGLSCSEENTSIACALTFDNNRKIEIVIAGSSNVKSVTVDYIRKVWKEMVAISDLSRSSYAGVDGMCLEDRSRALTHAIYTFCMPSFSKDFVKNTSRLREWVTVYKTWHTEQESSSIPAWLPRMHDLRPLVAIVENILKDLSVYENSVASSFAKTDETTLYKFISTMDSVMERGNELLQINPAYDPFKKNWNPLIVLGCLGDRTNIGRLRHCLEDLILFPQNIEKLRRFYLSRHFAEISSFELQIKVLNEGIYRAPHGAWPSGPLVWTQVYKYVHRKKHYRFVGKEDAHDFSRIPTDPLELVVHPELKIATYLNIVSHTLAEKGGHSTPPFNYISVTGLSCRPCALWLSKLSSLDRGHGIEFRGTSYEWPNNWCMPTMKAKEISRYIRNHAWDEYLEVQSTDGNMNSVKTQRRLRSTRLLDWD